MDPTVNPQENNNIPQTLGQDAPVPDSPEEAPLRILDIIRNADAPSVSRPENPVTTTPSQEAVSRPVFPPIQKASQQPLAEPISFVDFSKPLPPPASNPSKPTTTVEESSTPAITLPSEPKGVITLESFLNKQPTREMGIPINPEIQTAGVSVMPHITASAAPSEDSLPVLPVSEAAPMQGLGGRGQNISYMGESQEKPAKEREKQPSTSETPVESDPDNKSGRIIAPVHTLRDDMKSIVQGQNMSIMRATALEEAKRHARTKKEQEMEKLERKQRHPFSRLLLISIILFVLGGLSIGGFFLYRAYAERGLAAVPDVPSLIFAENTVPLPLDQMSPAILKSSLANARTNLSNAPGSIVRIIPTVSTTTVSGKLENRPATAKEFLVALGTELPLSLRGALDDDFFLGLQAGDGNTPVLIFTVNSYERAFSGMLDWESRMSEMLSPPFDRIPTTVEAQDGSLTNNPFKDVVIKNYDARVLTDPSNTNALMYSFPNRNLFIITSNPYTLTEILSRLQAARRL